MKYNIEKVYNHNGHIYLEGWLVGKKATDHTEFMIYGKNGAFYPAHILRLERLDVRNFYFPMEAIGSYGFMLRFTPSEEEAYVLHLIAGNQMKEIPFTLRQVIDLHTLPNAKNSELKSLFPFHKNTKGTQNFKQKYAYLPKFSILVSIHQKESEHLSDMFDSVLFQSYPEWELLVADCSGNIEVQHAVPLATERGERKIQYMKFSPQNTFANAQNSLLSKATGEFCVLLECNDVLEIHALERVVQILNQNQSLDFIYSDYDLSDSFGASRESVMFKPDWSPELFYSADYAARMSVFRTSVLKHIGGWEEATQSVNYLKLLEQPISVSHISEVLYHWRQQAVQHSSNSTENEIISYRETLQAHFTRMNWNTTVELMDEERQIFHIKWNNTPKELTLVLADTDSKCNLNDILLQWQTVLQRENIVYEIFVLAENQNRIKNITVPCKTLLGNPLESYRKLSYLAKQSSYSHILWAYSSILPSSQGFFKELMGWLNHPNIALVLPRLLYPKKTILSEGVFLQANMPISFHRQFQTYGKSYFGNTMWYRNVTTGCPDCFLASKKLLEEAPDFDGVFWFQKCCLWIQKEKRLRLLMTPFADAISNYEWVEDIKKSHLKEYQEFFKEYHLPDNDPYFNPNWIRQQL